MATRAQIVAAARACIGTPFRHQGRLPDRGLDCAGLIIYAGCSTGAADPYAFTNYPKFPNEGAVQYELAANMDRVPGGLKDAAAGDVVLLADHRYAVHMGVLAGEPSRFTLVHASARSPRCVTEGGLDADWQKLVRGVWRYRKVED